MSTEDFREGEAPFSIPGREEPGKTWYQVCGDLHGDVLPLILIHGGPGATHAVLGPFRDLWTQSRIPVVVYDQIGCGKSTRLPERRGDKELWQPTLFADELMNLIEHLGLSESGYNILGHSWGVQPAIAFASRQPSGLRRVIISGGNVNYAKLRESVWERLRSLPNAEQNERIVREAIDKDDFTTTEYKAVLGAVLHNIRVRTKGPPPPELLVVSAALAEDNTVNESLVGKSLFVTNGSMEHYSSIPLLSKILVPVLMINGECDFTATKSAPTFFEYLPRCRWVELGEGSHMPWLDSPQGREDTMKLVAEFLLPCRS